MAAEIFAKLQTIAVGEEDVPVEGIQWMYKPAMQEITPEASQASQSEAPYRKPFIGNGIIV